jgi:predicted RecB family nuclease
MRILDGRPLYTATDLSAFLACDHLSQLRRRLAAGEAFERDESAMAELLGELGARHEERYLALLESEGLSVKKFDVAITRDAAHAADLEHAAAETLAAMHNGFDVIYQGSFFDGRWFGRPDFLIRVAVPSVLGSYSYEVADAKLARRVRVEAVIQLCEYSSLLGSAQNKAPEHIRFVLGNLAVRSYPFDDFAAYHDTVKRRFLAAMDMGSPGTYPMPVRHCKTCDFLPTCAAQRRQDDHLSRVARMRNDQVHKLERSGVATMAALGASAAALEVPGLQATTLDTLRAQARLQLTGGLPDGTPRHELLEIAIAGQGLCALPAPSPGDLFFDMEGTALGRDESLEYLFGVVEIADGGPRYHSWWGHDARDERRAFEQFIDFVMTRLDADPSLHIYHYGDYERTALRTLMGRHASREAEVDSLLRGERLVDLYRVVRQGVRLSTETYGLKQVERLYRPARGGGIVDAAGSMVVYEKWLNYKESQPRAAQQLLDDIGRYNEDDCVSTWSLRQWLEARRCEEELRRGAALPRPESAGGEPSERLQVSFEVTQAVREALTAGVADEPALRSDAEQARWLLAQLVDYHRRERKSKWWRYFDHLEMTDRELHEDTDALGPLTHVLTVGPDKSATVDRYSFEPQEHAMRAGEEAVDPRARSGDRLGAPAGTVIAVDDAQGLVELRRPRAAVARGHPTFVIPGRIYQTSAQDESLLAIATWVTARGIDAPGAHRAARDLLLRRPPRRFDAGASTSAGVAAALPLRADGETAVEAALRVALSLDGGCLAIQGPPGSGKTYAAARVALAAVAAGGRVAVTATAHKAIGNLLDEICAAARQHAQPVRVLQKAKLSERGRDDDIDVTDSNDTVVAALRSGDADVVGGTSWLFARGELSESFDLVIVDEAGQMSLADVIALSRCARNLMLVGDPRQLAQVVQGSHPVGAAVSALQHLLGDEVTMPAERGIFLDETRRMHPRVCEFVSSVFYQRRLNAEPDCARQRLVCDGDDITGIWLSTLEHSGDRRSSEVEARHVRAVVDAMLGSRWRDREGSERELTLADILVMAPYNEHVGCLLHHLPAGARAGTVDRFQGQQAAVSVYSMATSSIEDLPRHLEFLYSSNRFNVAVSRARCASVVVCSRELLHARCQTPEQMRLVNALCRYQQMASVWDARRCGSHGAAARTGQLPLLI